MLNFEYIPHIRPVFSLIKKDCMDFERSAVTCKLKINPTETHGPVMGKGYLKYGQEDILDDFDGLSVIPASAPPYQILKHACWTLKLSKIGDWSIENPLHQLETLLFEKTNEIREICRDYNLCADLILQIFAKSNEMPEIVIPRKSVSFWASVGVEISFDFYLD